MPKSKDQHLLIGFIKYNDEIGLYEADNEAWILDAKRYAKATRQDIDVFLKRRDKRFSNSTLCPIRKDDILGLLSWFDSKAMIQPQDIANRLKTMDFSGLNARFEDHLPVLLYDFDDRIAYENPDRNPFLPFDDFLPEGWQNVVVEGFDALVPDVLNYWSRFEAVLEHRDESTL